MLDTVNNDNEKAKDMLATFAQYGFKKTSMADIARAMGISRQSVYKKFDQKLMIPNDHIILYKEFNLL